MYETDGVYLNGLALNVSLQGRIVLDERWHRSLVNDPFSRLYFVKEGQGWLIPEEGEKIAMESGRMYFVPAGLTFSYGCTHLEKIFFHINIAGEDGTDIFSATKKIGVLPFMPQEYECRVPCCGGVCGAVPAGRPGAPLQQNRTRRHAADPARYPHRLAS